MLSFDPARPPTPPRAASTVIVVTQGSPGVEVLCVVRHARSAFLGGALVFPGGKVDDDDGDDAWGGLSGELPPRAALLDEPAGAARTLLVAACRESLEEAAILPVEPALDDASVRALRDDAERTSFREALARRGLRLRLDTLVPFARWVTPEAEARRFDARFFVLELPPGQRGRHDDRETTSSFWATPADVLARAERGEVMLAPPTSRTLELLAAAQDLSHVRRIADAQSLQPICPRFVPSDARGRPFLALPGDPEHPLRDRLVAGPTRYVLVEGRFVAMDPDAG